MKIKIILIFILFLCLSSCTTNPIKDNYKIEIDEDEKTTYIENIIKTTSETITYMLKEDEKTIYIVYTFEKGNSTQKDIYTFHSSFETFQNDLQNHVNGLDGYYEEVKEEILLIKTTYDNIDKVEYDTLYQIIKENYQIIKDENNE